MDKADSVLSTQRGTAPTVQQQETTTERPAVAVDSSSILAAAVHPAWHQAIIRLANATERVAVRLEAFMGASAIDGRFDAAARELVESLIDYLDTSDPYAQDEREPDLGFPETSEWQQFNEWLGWLHRPEHLDQSRGFGGTLDLEEQCEDEGGSDEPTNEECRAVGEMLGYIHCSDDAEPCAGDEPELVNEDGDGNPDDEPSLGWPEHMAQGVSHGDSDDREDAAGPRQPQNRSQITGPLVSVENSYRRFVHGLTPEQRAAWKARQQPRKQRAVYDEVVLR